MKDSCEAWKRHKDPKILTWGEYLSGENLVEILDKKGYFKDGMRICEIGFGYNRFLNSLLKREYQFTYVGVDIGKNWVDQANRKHRKNKSIEFLEGDVRDRDFFIKLGKNRRFDLILSFVCLHHIKPTFAIPLRNFRLILDSKGLVIFDLPVVDKEKDEKVLEWEDAWARNYYLTEAELVICREFFKLLTKFRVQQGVHNRMCFIIRPWNVIRK